MAVQIGFGLVADQLGPVESLICCISVSGLLQLAMWRHIFSFKGITAFSALYGFVSRLDQPHDADISRDRLLIGFRSTLV
jgi:hypothetical protein